MVGILSPSVNRPVNLIPGSIVPRVSDQAITTFAGSHGYAFQTPGVGAQADDDVVFNRGTRSLKITTDGAHGVSFTRASNLTAIDFSAKVPKIWIRIDRPDWIEELWVMMASDNWSNFITWKPSSDMTQFTKTPGAWVPITLPWEAGILSSSPNRAAITSIQLRVRDNSGGAATVNFGGISKVAEGATAKGVVTMDDAWSTQYSVALPILDAVGIPGQIYVIPEKVGTSGYCTWAQLRDAQDNYGWGMSVHTLEDLSTVSTSKAESILINNKRRMLDQGLNSGLDHLAYANGGYNAALLPIIRKHFRTARTIANYMETNPPADWHRLRVKQVLNTATTSTSVVGAAITAAATGKSPFIPVYHKFETPDSTTMQRSIASFTTDAANMAASSISWTTMAGLYR